MAAEMCDISLKVIEQYETSLLEYALQGIAARTGHQSAQPILAHFGLESSVRLSFAFYNTQDEVDVLMETLRRISLK